MVKCAVPYDRWFAFFRVLKHQTSGLITSNDSQIGQAAQALSMRTGIVINVTPEDRRRLKAICRRFFCIEGN